MGDIRAQHSSASHEADETRNRLVHELTDTRQDVKRLETESGKLLEKYSKCKSQNEVMSADLQQYKENERLLQEKLKSEVKAKEEFAMVVQKREEKLKKKDRMLEEEQEAREKNEREVEQLRKQ